MRCLLDAGARINAAGRFGDALCAVKQLPEQDPKVVLELLERGILDFTNGKTRGWAMRWAAIIGHKKIVRFFIDKMSPLEKTSLLWTLESGSKGADYLLYIRSL